MVGAGMKPLAITSYNHLGNNDGLNLDAPSQFRSKEISKRNVVDDMVESNKILYKPNEKPDHVVVTRRQFILGMIIKILIFGYVFRSSNTCHQ